MLHLSDYFKGSANGNRNHRRKTRTGLLTPTSQADEHDVIQLESDGEEPAPKRQAVMSLAPLAKPTAKRSDPEANNAGAMPDVVVIEDDITSESKSSSSTSNDASRVKSILHPNPWSNPTIGNRDISKDKGAVMTREGALSDVITIDDEPTSYSNSSNDVSGGNSIVDISLNAAANPCYNSTTENPDKSRNRGAANIIQLEDDDLPELQSIFLTTWAKSPSLIDLSGDDVALPEPVENSSNTNTSESNAQEVSESQSCWSARGFGSEETNGDSTAEINLHDTQGSSGIDQHAQSSSEVVQTIVSSKEKKTVHSKYNSKPTNNGHQARKSRRQIGTVASNVRKSNSKLTTIGDLARKSRIQLSTVAKYAQASRYTTTYKPDNVPKGDYAEWMRVGREASDGSDERVDGNREYWIECIVDKRNIKIFGAEYLIKYMGYTLTAGGQFWWLPPERILGNCSEEDSKISQYERRETVMQKFAASLKDQLKENFDVKYPRYKQRKQFSAPNKSSDYSRHVDQLMRKESYINYLLDSHGQKPLYFANWTDDFVLSRDDKFMTRPNKWTEKSRKSLSFEYLLSIDVPQEILYEIAAKEAESYKRGDSTFKCTCQGVCTSKCPCVTNCESKFNKKVELVGNDLIFNTNCGTDNLFLSCGPKCRCSEDCIRRVPTKGRQYPLIIFYNENKGWGVHAACAIPKGAFLGIYTGILDRVRPTEDAHYQFLLSTDLPDKESGNPDDSIFYALDCGRAGNEFGIINHSCKGGNVKAFSFANCNSVVLYEIGFVATRDIEFGEELCYNYHLREGGEVSADDKDDKKPRVKCCCRPGCPNTI